MLLAAKSNGLTGDDVKPWHLKASFKLYDEQGNAKDQGTYEEFWVSPTKYRRSFKSNSFNQTLYGVEQGSMRAGDAIMPAGPLNDLRTTLVSPIPAAGFLALVNYSAELRDVEGIKRLCIDLRTRDLHSNAPKEPYYSYCFDTDNTLLQSTLGIQTHTRTSFKNTIRFRDHSLPGDIEVRKDTVVTLIAHLDIIEPLIKINKADFTPPSDAVSLPKATPGIVTKGVLITKVEPDYPIDAKADGIQGTVIIQATINVQGRTENLEVISGPTQLQQAALDAVKQWVYKPYLLNSKPVAVLTTISVIFKLGND